MKQSIIVPLIAALVFGAGGYFAGSAMAARTSPSARFAQAGNFAGGTFAGRNGGSARIGNNAVFGT
ncbi:MAG TPA: hypothetical protein VHD38_03140, partial [Candidatus Paceibacterota bacterium]|nr:hypothetical protein [Candidatus Paceibacterota bacterium]